MAKKWVRQIKDALTFTAALFTLIAFCIIAFIGGLFRRRVPAHKGEGNE